jgi:hypothetical protein
MWHTGVFCAFLLACTAVLATSHDALSADSKVRVVLPTTGPTDTGEIERVDATAAPPDQLDKDIQALIDRLKVAGAGNGITSTQLNELIAVLTGVVQKKDRDDPLKSEIDILQGKIAALSSGGSVALSDAFLTSLGSLANAADGLYIKADPKAARTRLTAQVPTAFGANAKGDDRIDQLKRLLAAIDTAWPSPDVAKVITLAPMLSKAVGETPSATLIAAITGDQTTLNTIIALHKVLTPIAVSGEMRFHIVSAIYGDRRTIASIIAKGKTVVPKGLDRWCNATAAMRKACEKAATCQPPADMETALCGYDPVPFISPQYKTVVITYRCLPANIPGNWTGVVGDSGMDGAYTPGPKKTSLSLSLWSKDQIAFCAPP